MIKRNACLVALPVLGLFMGISSPVLAGHAEGQAESGVYLSPNLGYGHTDLDSGSFTSSNGSLVLNPQMGYQFNRNAALELGYTHFAGYHGDVDTGSAALTSPVEVTSHYFDIALKGMYNLPGHFQLFGKAGVARVSTKYSSNISESGGESVATSSGTYRKNLLLLGAGVGYSFNQKMKVNVQVAATQSSYQIPSLLATTVGFSHLFAM